MPPAFACLVLVKPWANGRNIVVWPSTPNIVGCYTLRPFAHPVVCRWELLRPFGHHCQHGRNNCQHCWPDNIGSCCVRLDTSANTDATTPNIVGPKKLGVIASSCTWLTAFSQAITFMYFGDTSAETTWPEMHEATRKRQTCFVFLQHAERRRVLFLKKKNIDTGFVLFWALQIPWLSTTFSSFSWN